MMQRRQLLRALSSLGLVAPTFYFPVIAQSTIVEVWKDPNCGCCQSWVDHLEANGFKVEVRNVGNTSARKRLGMPEKLGSCHTAKVSGYVLEGHVPAADIRRLLTDRPVALGLAVPGMPIGSPGMDGPEYKGRKDSFDVLLVQKNGSTESFARYPGQSRMVM
jgi:hypothetical protein